MQDQAAFIGRECLAFSIRKLNRMITAIYDEALAAAGIQTSQFNVLVAASNCPASRPSELAKILAMDESTLSRNVERMCAKKLLRREADDDRRSHRITVTAKGLAVIGAAYPAWRKAQEEASRLLVQQGFAAIRSALKKPPV
jgi:DNA-binding MarR family transcriptional regulator